MSPEEFVAEVRMGNVAAETGSFVDGAMESRMEPLGTDDPEAITAEAFARGVFDFEMPWEDALAKVRELLA
jgi:hypothetical protein